MKKLIITSLALATAGFVAACSESGDGSGASTSTAGASDSTAWLLASAPENPTGVASIKESSSEGDKVVMRGIIGGRTAALSESSAVFVLVDESVHNECVSDDDHCATPWDYCCAAPAELMANNATVQLVDDAGAPMAIDLRKHGIQPLDHVIVVGTVAARPTPEVLTIKATAIYRDQS